MKSFILYSLLSVFLITCQSNPPEIKKTYKGAKLNVEAIKLAESNNRFGLDFYQELAKSKEENLCFSPLSLHTALGMLYFGTSGKTKTELQQKMYLSDNQSLSQDYFNLLGHIFQQNKDSTQVNVANAVWIQNDFKVEEEYIKLLRQYFESIPYSVDLTQESTKKQLNQWIQRETHNAIKDIDIELTADTHLILANALYFKGAWKSQFSEHQTNPDNFTLKNRQKVKVPMMSNMGEYAYYGDSQLKILALDYFNSQFSMFFILPDFKTNWQEFEKKLTYPQIQTWLKKMKSEELSQVKIPKFEFTQQVSADELLQKMGLRAPFIARNELNKIAENLFVGQIQHKTFIKIDEEGTEAAAVTEVAMVEEAPHEENAQPKTFIADHPFLFLIQEKQSGAILFIGRIMNPNKK